MRACQDVGRICCNFRMFSSKESVKREESIISDDLSVVNRMKNYLPSTVHFSYVCGSSFFVLMCICVSF
jgi:hypothetical protein